MPSHINPLLLGTGSLGIAAIVCAAIAWSKISQLSLPLSTIFPILNILIPLLTALIAPVSQRFIQQAKQRAARLLLPYLAYASTLPPFILLILSIVHATPGDIQTCNLQQHWLRMFVAKNDRAIRNIQTTLQCCGLNSIHDRAWPFPARGVDARACERTQGYAVPCAGPWQHEETIAATLIAVASFLNWLVVLLTVINSQRDEGQIRLPAWSANTRLIEDDANTGERTATRLVEEDGERGSDEGGENHERPEQQRIWEGP